MQTLNSKQQGITLIEIIISSTLGLILVAGIIQIFIANKAISRTQNAFARVQENGRVSMEFLAREIRAADYWGCLKNIDSFTNHLDTTHPLYDPKQHNFEAIEGISGTNNDGYNNSDSLTLAGLYGRELSLIEAMQDSSAVVMVPPDNNALDAGDVVFISNCKGGDIFQVASGFPGTTGLVSHQAGAPSTSTPGNADTICNLTGAASCADCFCQTYGLDATLHTGFNIYRFYIDLNSDGRPALFYEDRSQEPLPIASGVENMQITYGEDINNDGSADRYLEAENPALRMEHVVSIKINLLVASQNEVTKERQQLRYNWEEISAKNMNAPISTLAPDRRLRRVFTTTVFVRNRLP